MSAALTLLVSINTTLPIFETQDAYVCVTMDWWPENKCDYGHCPWGNASILRQDLQNPRLRNALAALAPVHLRIGGTAQDGITYGVGAEGDKCLQFSPAPPEPSNLFTEGCLTMDRWAEIQEFANATGADLVFGLNAKRGRNGTLTAAWDGQNALDFINYTVRSGLPVYGWQLGNEINYAPDVWAESYRQLRRIVERVYSEAGLPRPKLMGTDTKKWNRTFHEAFLPQVTAVLDVVTWHCYPLGPAYGMPGPLAKHELAVARRRPFYAKAAAAAKQVRNISQSMEIWMGESGGLYRSGHDNASNAFMNGFWYLDALGGFARAGHSVFCRQTLVGGFYELLDKQTLEPNPDFYGALLFRKLMGTQVLRANTRDPNHLQVYAHCARPWTWSNGTIGGAAAGAVTALFLNFGERNITVAGVEGIAQLVPRQEYHLTAPALNSRVVHLNGDPLRVGANGTLPPLDPHRVPAGMPDGGLVLAAQSLAFVVFEDAGAAACWGAGTSPASAAGVGLYGFKDFEPDSGEVPDGFENFEPDSGERSAEPSARLRGSRQSVLAPEA